MPTVINAVAPWEGELVWIGEPNVWTTNTGKTWESVDFTLKYKDSQMNEKHITFSVFGEGKVNTLLGYQIGTYLRVLWWPEANQGKNGKYYSKNNVINIYLIEHPAKTADTKITAPYYPQPQPPIPEEDRGYEPDSGDLPF